ncbi:MAG: DUF3391 domain-containing protein, partial [Bacteroidia bacterium]|nr:DUF3391 domain-containing protein [Methylotenera sp.]
MNDIRREKTQVSQLGIGMFVCELDRPWLDSPFMLEGVLIEDDEQIATIAALCEFVYVDRTVSVGNYFTAPPKEQVAIKRDGAIIRIQASTSSNKTSSKNKNVRAERQNIKPTSTNEKFSFFDVLKEIKASNQSSHSASINNATMPNALFNVHQLR